MLCGDDYFQNNLVELLTYFESNVVLLALSYIDYNCANNNNSNDKCFYED